MSTPALAGPDIYVDTIRIDVSQSECLENFKSALLSAGFDRDTIFPSTYTAKNGKVIQDGWQAHSSDENISVAFECDSRNGAGAVAVSGSNKQGTYKLYQKIFAIVFNK